MFTWAKLQVLRGQVHGNIHCPVTYCGKAMGKKLFYGRDRSKFFVLADFVFVLFCFDF